MSSASCGYEFQVDETYLVYATGKDLLYTGLCSRTTTFANAYEDLKALGVGTTPDDTPTPDSQYISPLRQFKAGIPLDEIQCRDEFINIIKSSNQMPSCLTRDTAEKLVNAGWGKYHIGLPHTYNTTFPDGNMADIKYNISGGQLKEAIFDIPSKSMIMKIQSYDNSLLDLLLPRGIIESADIDDSLFVLVDGSEVDYDEIRASQDYRYLSIPFQKNAEQIEIIGPLFQ